MATMRSRLRAGCSAACSRAAAPVADDAAWLRAMLAAEAALARALERAGLAPAGAGAAVTAAAARPGDFDLAELEPVVGADRQPGARAGAGADPPGARPGRQAAVHKGATSQDIMDTAAMLLARDAIDAAADSCRARPPPPRGWPTRTGGR